MSVLECTPQKKTLSSIISLAETFQSNTGFFLPNLREMYIPIKGKYSYNYKVICHKNGAVGDVLWQTNSIESDTCGQFDLKKTPDPNDPAKETLNDGDSCSSSATKCWMGAVLCQNYNPDSSISCGSAGDYTLRFQNRGVLQLKPADDENWGGANVKKKELSPSL